MKKTVIKITPLLILHMYISRIGHYAKHGARAYPFFYAEIYLLTAGARGAPHLARSDAINAFAPQKCKKKYLKDSCFSGQGVI